MTNIIPSRSLFNMLNHWPSLWDDDMDLIPSNMGNSIEVHETDDEVVVKANVAGVPSDKVDVTFERGYLWIQAKATEEEENKNKKFYSKASWNYSYKIAVPGDIDHAKEPSVVLDDGVLTATFHKKEIAKPKKLTVKRMQK